MERLGYGSASEAGREHQEVASARRLSQRVEVPKSVDYDDDQNHDCVVYHSGTLYKNNSEATRNYLSS